MIMNQLLLAENTICHVSLFYHLFLNSVTFDHIRQISNHIIVYSISSAIRPTSRDLYCADKEEVVICTIDSQVHADMDMQV